MSTVHAIGTGTKVLETVEGNRQYKTLKLASKATEDSPIEITFNGQRFLKQTLEKNGKKEITYVCVDEEPTELSKTEANKYAKEKTCEDGKDDGKISWTEKLKSMGKGIIKPFASMFNFSSTKETLKSVGKIALAGTLAVVSCVFPPVGMGLLAVGTIMGAATLGVGAYQSCNAKTDAEEKNAWENIGNGAFTLVTSLIGIKAMRNAAASKAAAIKDAQAPKLPPSEGFAPKPTSPVSDTIHIDTANPSILTRVKTAAAEKLQGAVDGAKEAYHVGKDVVTLGKETRGTFSAVKNATKDIKALEKTGVKFDILPNKVDAKYFEALTNLEKAIQNGELLNMQKEVSVLDGLVAHVSKGTELNELQLATIVKAKSILDSIKTSNIPRTKLFTATVAGENTLLNPFEDSIADKIQPYSFAT